MTHFDHERIPERIVHARGYAAHGEFELYESMKEYTKAKFLQDPSVKTPVFVRFSTVAGSRGSAETVHAGLRPNFIRKKETMIWSEITFLSFSFRMP
jgi:catalase